MSRDRHFVFLLNLLQDVNIIRPLAYLAGREFDCAMTYLVSARFLERDTLRDWQREISEIAAETGGRIHIYDSPLDALAVLQGKQGIIVAASESTLANHADTHNVFRVAPPGFLKITLQHGYECVGFLQNREHVIAHGRNIKFGADVVCGWCDAPALTSLAASERPKLYVTGPPMVLNRAGHYGGGGNEARGGLICENLHSARLRATGDHGKSFMENFGRFCDAVGETGGTVGLRPHPGGMYVLKNNVPLPPNVVIQNQPIYKVDLRHYDFGISAPSTVVLDMVLAGIPVAVWRDGDGIMDASNYDGLTPISGLDSWLAFARDAVEDRDAILEQQRRFLARMTMPTDPAEVYRRFARLFGGAMRAGEAHSPTERAPPHPKRIAFIANGMIPTLQLSFLKPLAPLVDAGEIVCEFITEVEASELFPVKENRRFVPIEERHANIGNWIGERLGAFAPDLIVACRYSAPGAESIISWAREAGVPLVFHIDDDLLNIPREIGEKKFLAHNHPNRLKTVDALLGGADLIYASTAKLKSRIRQLSYRTPMMHGAIYASGRILSPAERRPVSRVGYMGFDHAHDFELALPQLVRYLRRNPEIVFELFGSIPKPAALDEFGERIVIIEPVRNYEEFMQVFATRQWDIGLCPLARTPFNEVKANTKWVEYTSVGAAVLATRGLVYDACCAGGCGLLLEDDEWLDAMERLTDDPDARYDMVARAQARVESDYNVEKLGQQVLEVFGAARGMVDAAGENAWPHVPPGPLARAALPAEALFG